MFLITVLIATLTFMIQYFWLSFDNKKNFTKLYEDQNYKIESVSNEIYYSSKDIINLNSNFQTQDTTQALLTEVIKEINSTSLSTNNNKESTSTEHHHDLENNITTSLLFETTNPTSLDIIKNSSISFNENKKPSIFCFILTTKNRLDTRTKLIHDSWARLCDNHKFITLRPNGTENSSEIIYNGMKLLQPPGFLEDRYSFLTRKIFLSIKYIYQKYNDYDWYLKADDDTFILVNNLRNFLSTKNSSQPVTYGYDFRVIVEKGYHSGGAGYVLSKEAFNRLGQQLNKNYSFCPDSGIEDVDVANCLRMLKVYPNSSIDDKKRERFHPQELTLHYEGHRNLDWLHTYAANPLKNVISFIN